MTVTSHASGYVITRLGRCDGRAASRYHPYVILRLMLTKLISIAAACALTCCCIALFTRELPDSDMAAAAARAPSIYITHGGETLMMDACHTGR